MGHISRLVPILFQADEDIFTHNGLGRLSDATKCEVTEVLNGEFELLMAYPVNGAKYSLIEDNMLILAKPNPYDQPHVFRIYEHHLSSNENSLEIYARTNTADLADNMVSETAIVDKTPAQAMTSLGSVAIDPCDFLFISDIVELGSVKWTRRNLLSCITGEEDSVLQVWGGEVQHGNKEIAVYQRRGTDTDVTIRHGRNLRGLTVTYSTQGIVTAILPYTRLGTDEEGNEEILIGTVVRSPNESNYPHAFIKDVEFPIEQYGTEVVTQDPDSGYETTTLVMTLSDLNDAAATWFDDNPDMDVPSINIEVEIENLSQTEDYAQFKDFETLRLGDTITVWAEKYNVELTARVVKVVYDCLSDRNLELEVGKIKETGFQSYQKSIYNNFVKPVAHRATYAQTAANQKNRVFRGTNMPSVGMKYNDLWYKPVGEGEIELYRYDGLVWNLEKVSGGLIQGVLDADSGDLDIINLNASNITSGKIDTSLIVLEDNTNLQETIINIGSEIEAQATAVVLLGESLDDITDILSHIDTEQRITVLDRLALKAEYDRVRTENSHLALILANVDDSMLDGYAGAISEYDTAATAVLGWLAYATDAPNFSDVDTSEWADLQADYLEALDRVNQLVQIVETQHRAELTSQMLEFEQQQGEFRERVRIDAQGLTINVNDENALTIQNDGMRIFVEGVERAEFTSSGFSADQGRVDTLQVGAHIVSRDGDFTVWRPI